LAGAQYRLSNEKMIEQVERVLIDIADQHRAGLKTQEFWTRTAAEVLSELKNPPPSQAGDMWLDTNEYDLWGGFPPTDEPPKDSHD
jgi:hypothetical protein